MGEGENNSHQFQDWPHADRQRKDSQLNSNFTVLLFKIMHAWFDANLIYIFSSFPGEM